MIFYVIYGSEFKLTEEYGNRCYAFPRTESQKQKQDIKLKFPASNTVVNLLSDTKTFTFKSIYRCDN